MTRKLDVPEKLPFKDFHEILERKPRCFYLNDNLYDFPSLRDLVRKFDDYVDKLYTLAAEGHDWQQYLGQDIVVFREYFKETSKRLDTVRADNIKKNNLSESLIKIKH